MRLSLKAIALAATSLTPATALAAPAHRLSVGGVFADAAPVVKIIAVLLITTIAAAPALLALGRGGKLGVLTRGAPLLALAAALFTLFSAALGVANSPVVPSATVLAPALAESLLLLVLGALATFAAVVCRELAKPRALS